MMNETGTTTNPTSDNPLAYSTSDFNEVALSNDTVTSLPQTTKTNPALMSSRTADLLASLTLTSDNELFGVMEEEEPASASSTLQGSTGVVPGVTGRETGPEISVPEPPLAVPNTVLQDDDEDEDDFFASSARQKLLERSVGVDYNDLFGGNDVVEEDMPFVEDNASNDQAIAAGAGLVVQDHRSVAAANLHPATTTSVHEFQSTIASDPLSSSSSNSPYAQPPAAMVMDPLSMANSGGGFFQQQQQQQQQQQYHQANNIINQQQQHQQQEDVFHSVVQYRDHSASAIFSTAGGGGGGQQQSSMMNQQQSYNSNGNVMAAPPPAPANHSMNANMQHHMNPNNYNYSGNGNASNNFNFSSSASVASSITNNSQFQNPANSNLAVATSSFAIPPKSPMKLPPVVLPPPPPPKYKSVHVNNPILIHSGGGFFSSHNSYWSFEVTSTMNPEYSGTGRIPPAFLNGQASVTVRRRFRHFVSLEEKLRDSCRGCILPPRPEKHAIRAIEEAGGQSEEFALARARELDEYMSLGT